MVIDAGTTITIDGPPDVVFEALRMLVKSADGNPDGSAVTWHLTHTEATMTSALPGEGASGSAQWDGGDFRAAAHLVPDLSDATTLLVLSAEPVAAAEGANVTTHSRAALRHARAACAPWLRPGRAGHADEATLRIRERRCARVGRLRGTHDLQSQAHETGEGEAPQHGAVELPSAATKEPECH